MNTDGGISAVAAPAVAPVAQAAQAAAQAAKPSLQLIWELGLAIALTLIFLTVLVKALPWHADTLKKRPFSCNACMLGWLSIGLGLFLSYVLGLHYTMLVAHLLPATGLAFVGLSLIDYWRPPLQ